MPKIKKTLEVAAAGSFGAAASWALSSPKSPIEKRLPLESIKSFEVSPNILFKGKNETIHLHHWVFLGIFYGSLVVMKKSFRGKKLFDGFLLGLILQGLSYKDRFKFENRSKQKSLKS